MKVRFPIYFEVVGHGEMEVPDDLADADEEILKQYVADHWDDVPLPDMNTVDYVDGSCEFDWDAPFEIER